MITLNLTAKNTEQEVVKQYLEENASEMLAEKINNGVAIEKDGKTCLVLKPFLVKRVNVHKTSSGFNVYLIITGPRISFSCWAIYGNVHKIAFLTPSAIFHKLINQFV